MLSSLRDSWTRESKSDSAGTQLPPGEAPSHSYELVNVDSVTGSIRYY